MAGAGAAYGLVVALCLGTGLGWGLDHWWKSSPWGLLLGAGLGFASGLLQLRRAMLGEGPEPPPSPPTPRGHESESTR